MATGQITIKFVFLTLVLRSKKINSSNKSGTCNSGIIFSSSTSIPNLLLSVRNNVL